MKSLTDTLTVGKRRCRQALHRVNVSFPIPKIGTEFRVLKKYGILDFVSDAPLCTQPRWFATAQSCSPAGLDEVHTGNTDSQGTSTILSVYRIAFMHFSISRTIQLCFSCTGIVGEAFWRQCKQFTSS